MSACACSDDGCSLKAFLHLLQIRGFVCVCVCVGKGNSQSFCSFEGTLEVFTAFLKNILFYLGKKNDFNALVSRFRGCCIYYADGKRAVSLAAPFSVLWLGFCFFLFSLPHRRHLTEFLDKKKCRGNAFGFTF